MSTLFEQVYDWSNLINAYEETQSISRSRRKRGGTAPGLDGLRIETVENKETFCREIRRKLKTRTYQAQPVKAARGEQKSNGEFRQLSVPCLVDQIVQRAALSVLSPIIDPTFEDCSYGGRPGLDGRNVMVADIGGAIRQGYVEAAGVDLEKFFDSIQHSLVMDGLRKKIHDEDVLSLILQWLHAPRFEQAVYDRIQSAGSLMAEALQDKVSVGVRQGGPISPLLANIAGHEIDVDCKGMSDVVMFRYVDDVVLLGKSASSLQKGINTLRESLSSKDLALNDAKTRIGNLVVDWRTSTRWFDVLGYAIQARGDTETGRIIPHVKVADRKKSEFYVRMRQAIEDHQAEGVPAVVQAVWGTDGTVEKHVAAYPIVASASDDDGDMFSSVIEAWQRALQETQWLNRIRNEKKRNRLVQLNIAKTWKARVDKRAWRIRDIEKWNNQHPTKRRKVPPELEPLIETVIVGVGSTAQERRVLNLEHQVLSYIINQIAGRYTWSLNQVADRRLRRFQTFIRSGGTSIWSRLVPRTALRTG